MVEYNWIKGRGKGFEDAAKVRQRVFMEEQGFCNEFDETDDVALHVVGYEEGAALCTARMFETAPGEWHIGRVAVLKEGRGKGCGLAMMQEMLQKAKEVGAACLVLEAQADKTAFYQRAGFVATGKTSLDEGMPHAEMRLELA